MHSLHALACEHIKMRRHDAIQGLIMQHPLAFFVPIDASMKEVSNRTILHLACEYNSSRVVKMVFDLLFNETEDEDLRN